jgi:tetratricopeptide (TPR) repeat protein
VKTLLVDARGLAVSTQDRDALDRYEAALEQFHSGRGDALAAIESVLVGAPDFVAAQCLRAAAWVSGGERPCGRALREAIGTIDRAVDRANERERRHLTAARAWLSGDATLALARYGAIVNDFPLDSVALQLAHTLDFRLGRRESLRDRVLFVLPHWDASLPGYGTLLGLLAFGYEENGDYARAHATALDALAVDPRNASAMHAVAHVLEMRGQAHEGIAWMESTRGVWEENASYAVHMAWHLALFHVDLDEAGAALAVYDRLIGPGASRSTKALVDASALLWRLALRGHRESARWRALARAWQNKRLRGERAFNLVHAVITLASAGELGPARRAATLLAEDAATRRSNTAEDLALAVPLSHGLLAFVDEDYVHALGTLKAVRTSAQRCGGSVAQCDLIHLTLVEAALRAELAHLARALAVERAASRPDSSLSRWLLERAEAIDPAPLLFGIAVTIRS